MKNKTGDTFYMFLINMTSTVIKPFTINLLPQTYLINYYSACWNVMKVCFRTISFGPLSCQYCHHEIIQFGLISNNIQVLAHLLFGCCFLLGFFVVILQIKAALPQPENDQFQNYSVLMYCPMYLYSVYKNIHPVGLLTLLLHLQISHYQQKNSFYDKKVYEKLF